MTDRLRGGRILSSLGRLLVLFGLSWRMLSSAQIPTVLDPGFNPGSGANDDIFEVTLQADGRILVGGQFTSFNGAFRSRLVRLDPDGSLDPAFDIGPGANGDVYAVAVQPDGRILVGGQFTSFNGEEAGYLTRLLDHGGVDTSFQATANGGLRDIVLEPDGRMVIVGGFSFVDGVSRNGVARLHADGTLDPSFDPGLGANASIRTILRQSDGKFLIGGQFTLFNGVSRYYVARLNANGTLDAGFNPPFLNDVVRGIARQADGRILVAGEFTQVSLAAHPPLARLHPDGRLDESFIAPAINGTTIRTVLVQPDGRILLGGSFTSIAGSLRFRIARLEPNGALDLTWNPGSGANDEVFSLALQENGMIVAGGQFWTVNGVSQGHVTRVFGDTRVNLFEFDAASYRVNEAAEAFNVSIRRTGDASATQSVDLQSVPGTALAGVDYAVPDARVTFQPGQFEKIMVIFLRTDGLVEALETLTLRLRNPTLGVGLGTRSNAVVTIEDGTSFVQFSHPVYSTQEGQYGFATSYVEAILVRTGWLGSASIKFHTRSGTASAGLDFVQFTNIAYFSAGEEQAYATIPILNDGLVEPTESFTVTMHEVFGGQPGSRTNATIHILDNDLPLQFESPTYAGSEQAGAAVAVVRRGDDGAGIASVDYSTTPGTAQAGSDFVPRIGTLTFSPGEVRKFISIPVTSDCVAEPVESFTLVLSNPTGGAVLETNDVAVLQITDQAMAGATDMGFRAATNLDPPFVVQADGRIIVVAERSNENESARRGPIRLLPDGTRDPSFNAPFFFGPNTARFNVTALASQPDGKVLVGAWRFDEFVYHYLVRLNQDGSTDLSFAGIYEVGFAREEIRTIAVQPDGAILVGGIRTYGGAVPKGLRRLTAAGLPDDPFDANLGLGLSGSNGVTSIALQLDGKIVVGGDFYRVDTASAPGITRLHSDGRRDTNFQTTFVFHGEVKSVAVSDVGGTEKIFLGGSLVAYDQVFLVRYGVLRLEPDGALDASFQSGSGGDYFVVEALMPQPDGGVLIGGPFDRLQGKERPGIARLMKNGSLDLSYQAEPNMAVSQFGVQPDGKVIVGGVMAGVDPAFTLTRLTGDPQVRFIDVVRSGPGLTQLLLEGPAGTTHRVEHSSDLRGWTLLGTVAFRGCRELMNDATAARSRYYRTIPVLP